MRNYTTTSQLSFLMPLYRLRTALGSKFNFLVFPFLIYFLLMGNVQASTEKEILANAFSLIDSIPLDAVSDMREKTKMVIDPRISFSLARFQPPNIVTISMPVKIYKREYTVLASNIEKIDRPDFSHYITVLTALSLANESAHFVQYQSGSLDDFFTLMQNGERNSACSLYALQQHISDLSMLEAAIKLENYFLGQGSIKGIKAIRLALERMDLQSVFESLKISLAKKNKEETHATLETIYKIRASDNIKSISRCRYFSSVPLEKDIYNRAIYPQIHFINKLSVIPKKSISTLSYNE